EGTGRADHHAVAVPLEGAEALGEGAHGPFEGRARVARRSEHAVCLGATRPGLKAAGDSVRAECPNRAVSRGVGRRCGPPTGRSTTRSKPAISTPCRASGTTARTSSAPIRGGPGYGGGPRS